MWKEWLRECTDADQDDADDDDDVDDENNNTVKTCL